MVYHSSMSREQEKFIAQLDERILRSVLTASQGISKNHSTIFNCHCPFCHGIRRGPIQSKVTPHSTANIFRHKNGEGLSFGCASCHKVVYSVHQLLLELGHIDLADQYAQQRYDCDRACGRGWTCPNPSSVKQELTNNRRCMREKAALQKLRRLT